MANPEMGWNVQSADWTRKKITTLSKFKNKKESGFVEAILGSWHLYGNGDHIHVYTFFDSWDNFASFEKASSYDVTKDMG